MPETYTIDGGRITATDERGAIRLLLSASDYARAARTAVGGREDYNGDLGIHAAQEVLEQVFMRAHELDREERLSFARALRSYLVAYEEMEARRGEDLDA